MRWSFNFCLPVCALPLSQLWNLLFWCRCSKTMWKKNSDSLQSLPKYNDLYYITVKALKKYKNGETAMLTRLISQVGSYDLHNVDGKDRCSCKKHGMKCSMLMAMQKFLMLKCKCSSWSWMWQWLWWRLVRDASNCKDYLQTKPTELPYACVLWLFMSEVAYLCTAILFL